MESRVQRRGSSLPGKTPGGPPAEEEGDAGEPEERDEEEQPPFAEGRDRRTARWTVANRADAGPQVGPLDLDPVEGSPLRRGRDQPLWLVRRIVPPSAGVAAGIA